MAYNSEIWSIIIMVGHGSIQVERMLEKEMKKLHLDLQATGNDLT